MKYFPALLAAILTCGPAIAQNAPANAADSHQGSSNACTENSGLGEWQQKPAWNGWGAGIANSRFQDAAGAQLTPEQVSHLKLKWAFGFPGAKSVYSQPTLVGGR